jgi:hypothetical protein
MLDSRPEYIWGVAKIRTCAPIIDRVKLRYSEKETRITYINYEKIGRICLFCGVMFHTVGNCYLRQQIVTEKIRLGQSAQDVPFQRYGPWIIDAAEIPASFVAEGQGCNPVFSNFQNPHISRFYKVSKTQSRRRGTIEEKNNTSELICGWDSQVRRSLQFNEGTSLRGKEKQVDKSTIHPPASIQGGNQGHNGELNEQLLYEGHLQRNDSVTRNPEQSGAERNTDEYARSGGPAAVIQDIPPARERSHIDTLPYSIGEAE